MTDDLDFSNIESKSFVDLPDHTPSIETPLEGVGIGRRPHYIRILDPFTEDLTRFLANLRIYSDLPSSQKGLHMSRIEQTLYRMGDEENELSLPEYALEVARRVRNQQDQETARIEISALCEHPVAKNPSGRPSYELIKLHAEAFAGLKEEIVEPGITVPFLNACPCARRWEIREFYQYLQENTDLGEEDIRRIASDAPLQSHTNRGDATLKIGSSAISLADIYNTLEDAVPLIRELLSGEDEHEVIQKAYAKPMFCEDVAREIIRSTVEGFKEKLESEITVTLTVDVDESIHHHNLRCEVEETFGELRSMF